MAGAITRTRGNQIRDLPGHLLTAWALLFSSLVIMSWRVEVHRADYEWLEFPTALGDQNYYRPGEGLNLGVDDFSEPNLRFQSNGISYQLYRQLHQPTRRKDGRMRKLAKEEGGRFFVYTDDLQKQQQQVRQAPRIYLKTDEDAYIEFGPARAGDASG